MAERKQTANSAPARTGHGQATPAGRRAVNGGRVQEFLVTREFDAPRELVFKAWTDPDGLAKWWGPKGFILLVARLDLRPGGLFHYSMRSPDNQTMWGKLVYREITPPERIEFVVSFADQAANTVRAPFSPNWPLEVLSTVQFAEHNSKTTLTVRGVPINATEIECRTFEEGFKSMQQGWKGTLDQLADFTASADRFVTAK